jgi:hypothetical protein
MWSTSSSAIGQCFIYTLSADVSAAADAHMLRLSFSLLQPLPLAATSRTL